MRSTVLRIVFSSMLAPVVLVAAAASAGHGAPVLNALWRDDPIDVNGDMAEWAGAPLTDLKGGGAVVGGSNDGLALYVVFFSRDARWTRSIATTGISVWVTNTGKKRKDLGIRCGRSSAAAAKRAGGSGEGGFWDCMSDEARQRLERLRAAAIEDATVVVKKGKKTITAPADGSCGPSACCDGSDSLFVCELSVPLRKMDGDSFWVGAEPGQTIYLGFEWGGMDAGERGRMMDGMGGGEMGPMPPYGGTFSDNEGMGGPGGMPTATPFERREVWVKVALASGPLAE